MNFSIIRAFILCTVFFLSHAHGMSVWDLPANANQHTVTSLAIHPEGNYVLLGTRDGSVCSVSLNNGNITLIGPQFSRSIDKLIFSPNGSFFAAQCFDPTHPTDHHDVKLSNATMMIFREDGTVFKAFDRTLFHNFVIKNDGTAAFSNAHKFSIDNTGHTFSYTYNNVLNIRPPHSHISYQRHVRTSYHSQFAALQGKLIRTAGHEIYLGDKRLDHYPDAAITQLDVYERLGLIMSLGGTPTGNSLTKSRITIWDINGNLKTSIKLPDHALLFAAKITPQCEIIFVVYIRNQFSIITILPQIKNPVKQIQKQAFGLQREIIPTVLTGHHNLGLAADDSFVLTKNHDALCHQEWDSDTSSGEEDESDDDAKPADRGETPPAGKRIRKAPDAPRRRPGTSSRRLASDDDDNDGSIAGGQI